MMEDFRQIITRLDPEFLATQVRKPEGEIGKLIAHALDECNKEQIRACYQKAIQLKPKRILEIGFGRGSYLQELLFSKRTQLFGIDISKTMVELAVQLNPSDKINLEQGDVHSLPYEGGFFDVVLSINSVYFWKDIGVSLKEIKRVLKPNGQLILGFSPKETLKQLSYTWSHFNHYTLNGLTGLLESSGFNISDFTSNNSELSMCSICAQKSLPTVKGDKKSSSSGILVT